MTMSLLRFSGAGGIRTHVRTRKPYAFYMLIPAFGFRVAAEPGPSTDTLSPLNFIKAAGHTLTISDLSAPLDQEDSEQHPLSDVSSHHLVTGLSQSTILQLRQRERNFFRQL